MVYNGDTFEITGMRKICKARDYPFNFIAMKKIFKKFSLVIFLLF